MLDTNKLLEYNKRALAIAYEHPLDYHCRPEYRAIIDERSKAQEEAERSIANERLHT